MKKFKIEYDIYNPVTLFLSNRLEKTIIENNPYNAVALLGNKIIRDVVINIYSVQEIS
jgi:hypothetical protein